MKIRLLLCGAILVVVGCAAPENPFVVSGDAGFTYDLVPQPVPDISPIDLDKIYHPLAAAPAASYATPPQ